MYILVYVVSSSDMNLNFALQKKSMHCVSMFSFLSIKGLTIKVLHLRALICLEETLKMYYLLLVQMFAEAQRYESLLVATI